MIKKTTKKNIMTRYFIIIMMMGLVGLAVIVKAGYIMFFKKAYWETVDNKFIVVRKGKKKYNLVKFK